MPRRDLHTDILEAGTRVIRRVGMTRTTTKEVAVEAECSEGSLYYHFSDRGDLLAHIVGASLDSARRDLEALADSLGEEPEPQALRALITGLLNSYVDLIGLTAPLLGDSEVLHRFRGLVEPTGLPGPHEVVSDYVARRQSQGVFEAGIDPSVAALVVAGACHHHALEVHLVGTSVPSLDVVAERITALLHPALT